MSIFPGRRPIMKENPAPGVGKAAEDYFVSGGLLCAESVVLAIAEAQAIESDILPKIATAFCSGMSRTSGTCGAVIGAVMGVSLLFGRSTAEESNEASYCLTQEFLDAFEKEFGSINCRELLDGCELNTPEGQAMFNDQEFKKLRCSRFVGKAAEIAVRIITENQR